MPTPVSSFTGFFVLVIHLSHYLLICSFQSHPSVSPARLSSLFAHTRIHKGSKRVLRCQSTHTRQLQITRYSRCLSSRPPLCQNNTQKISCCCINFRHNCLIDLSHSPLFNLPQVSPFYFLSSVVFLFIFLCTIFVSCFMCHQQRLCSSNTLLNLNFVTSVLCSVSRFILGNSL